MIEERALEFDCEGESLVGILSGARSGVRRGVLVVVGGPQYRAGSHRQFTLLARHLAEYGLPALRFDYRGIGATSPVVLGEPGDAALLGTVTLESMALVLNPFDRTLSPMRLTLAGIPSRAGYPAVT